MKNILGIGNALVDIMTMLEDDNHLETIGLSRGSMTLVEKQQVETILKKSNNLHQIQSSGGSAANTIHGTAHLGIESGYLGKIGTDSYGKFFSDDLKKSHIIPHVITGESETGKAVAFVSKDAERTFATYLGAAVEMIPADINPDVFRTYDVFHIEGYLLFNHDLILHILDLAKRNNMFVSLDMASFNVVEANRDFLKEIINKYVHIVFANEEEAKAYTQEDPVNALKIFAEQTNIAIVKVGKDGSMIKSKNDIYNINAIQANAIDTTGAGDMYASGFLSGFIKHKSLPECGRIGSLIAGKVTEVIGAKLSEQQWKEVYAQL